MVSRGALIIGGAAVAAVGVAWWASRPKGGITVPKVREPGWSARLRNSVALSYPGAQDVPAGATAELVRMRRDYGEVEFEGRMVPRAPMKRLAKVSVAWSNLLLLSGAAAGVHVPSLGGEGGWIADGPGQVAISWVTVTTPKYEARAGLFAADLVSLPDVAAWMDAFIAMAVALDVEDDFAPANPDNRTYWDFLWAEAKTSPATKIAFWPIYAPYKGASLAWDYLPDAAVTVLQDILGPAVKFIVTTFAVVLFVAGVGLFVWYKLGKPGLPQGAP